MSGNGSHCCSATFRTSVGTSQGWGSAPARASRAGAACPLQGQARRSRNSSWLKQQLWAAIAGNEAKETVSSRLDQVTDWAALAKSSRYCAAKLARECQVSARQLERYFQTKHHAAPHQWLNELRQMQGRLLISQGKSVKEAAFELGYKRPAHFTRGFKQFHGVPPTEFWSSPPPQKPL